jgi:hypothetical protein
VRVTSQPTRIMGIMDAKDTLDDSVPPKRKAATRVAYGIPEDSDSKAQKIL